LVRSLKLLHNSKRHKSLGAKNYHNILKGCTFDELRLTLTGLTIDQCMDVFHGIVPVFKNHQKTIKRFAKYKFVDEVGGETPMETNNDRSSEI
jgi:hypothetical protein